MRGGEARREPGGAGGRKKDRLGIIEMTAAAVEQKHSKLPINSEARTQAIVASSACDETKAFKGYTDRHREVKTKTRRTKK